jgi:hypothetical protein
VNAINRSESYAVRTVREEVNGARTALETLSKRLASVDLGEMHSHARWEELAQAAANVARLDDVLESLLEGKEVLELHGKLAYELTGAVCRDEQRLSAQCDRRALAHVLRVLERVL